MRPSMRLVYLGTPAMAVPPLHALVDAGHDIVLVVTGADKRRGRGGATSANPVKVAALDLGLLVTHDINDVVRVEADLGVVVAYGRIIKPHVLAHLHMINLHFSLLPRWRGAAPVERALLEGDAETGVCVMAVEEGLDTGGVYARAVVAVPDRATADDLRHLLVGVGTKLLVDTLDAGLGEAETQVGEPVYAAKITPEELRIDWNASVEQIDRLIRLGGAWTTWRGARLKMHAADAIDGTVAPTIVQPEGKPRISYADWRNGAQPAPDEWFV